MMDRMDSEIIFAKVYSKTRKSIFKFALHFLHRDGKIFKTTAVSYLSACGWPPVVHNEKSYDKITQRPKLCSFTGQVQHMPFTCEFES